MDKTKILIIEDEEAIADLLNGYRQSPYRSRSRICSEFLLPISP